MIRRRKRDIGSYACIRAILPIAVCEDFICYSCWTVYDKQLLRLTTLPFLIFRCSSSKSLGLESVSEKESWEVLFTYCTENVG